MSFRPQISSVLCEQGGAHAEPSAGGGDHCLAHGRALYDVRLDGEHGEGLALLSKQRNSPVMSL